MAKTYDFGGWATRNNLRCSDGRIIIKDAFKDQDGAKVPLVWNHQHNDVDNVLGHALLENRDSGVYAYCTLNDTKAGRKAKRLVEHGDIDQLSIYANKLQQSGANVVHGAIREVSLVLTGANPGAFIDTISFSHGEDFDEEEAVIRFSEPLSISHSGTKTEEVNKGEEKPMLDDVIMHEDQQIKDDNVTVQDIFNTLNEDQRTVVYALVAQAKEDGMKEASGSKKEEDEEDMKHNVFDGENEMMGVDVLTHAEMEMIMEDAKRYGSLRESVLAHSQEYGIENIDYLFPEARTINNTPEFIKRDTTWVGDVMNGVHKSPFSRVKSVFADITEDEARAKGYMKGELKKEEVFSLLKRTTEPQTIYKKQKLDRDDVIDIVDLDVAAFVKGEMRIMLDEEIARAILVGDGRLTSDNDHIKHDKIRPIWTDAPLYTINARLTAPSNADSDVKAKNFIKTAIKARKNYKGSGNPTMFMTEDMLTDCLLLEDKNGRVIYDTEEKLRTALRVSKISTVPVMENLTREDSSETLQLHGIIVNLSDYNVGADKGGAVNMFDDFDIDYNQMKYLIETRCSGALIKPYSAIVIEEKVESSDISA